MPPSIEAADIALATIFTGVLYVSVHTGDPGRVGGSEVTGGGYQRQAATFSRPRQGAVGNNATLYFENMPEFRPTHFGVWTGAGAFRWSGVLRPPRGVAALTPIHQGNTLVIGVGEVQIVME